MGLGTLGSFTTYVASLVRLSTGIREDTYRVWCPAAPDVPGAGKHFGCAMPIMRQASRHGVKPAPYRPLIRMTTAGLGATLQGLENGKDGALPGTARLPTERMCCQERSSQVIGTFHYAHKVGSPSTAPTKLTVLQMSLLLALNPCHAHAPGTAQKVGACLA